jgi:type IV secretory pathway TrbL component
MYTENVSWMRVVFGSTEDTVAHLLLLIGCLGTILLAVLMAAWIMLFFVVFKLATVIALVFLAFLMFEGTRFMAAPGLARILAYGVQMLVLGLATGLFFMTLDALDLSGHLQVNQSLALLVVMFFFALLFKYTTDLAREQVSGMPSLGLHDIGHTMGRGAMMGAAMLPGAAGVAGAMLRSAGGMPSLPSFRGPAMGWRGPSGGGSAGGGSSMPSTGGIGGGGAPASVHRMLARPPIDATWTEARDLPKTASRLLEAQRSLPAPPRQLPPPRS